MSPDLSRTKFGQKSLSWVLPASIAVLLSLVTFAPTQTNAQLNNLNVYELAWGFSLRRSCYVCADCKDKGRAQECPNGMGRYCVETRYAPPIGPWKWDRYCYFVCPKDVGANVEPYIISRCCESDLCNKASPSVTSIRWFYFPILAMMSKLAMV